MKCLVLFLTCREQCGCCNAWVSLLVLSRIRIGNCFWSACSADRIAREIVLDWIWFQEAAWLSGQDTGLEIWISRVPVPLWPELDLYRVVSGSTPRQPLGILNVLNLFHWPWKAPGRGAQLIIHSFIVFSATLSSYYRWFSTLYCWANANTCRSFLLRLAARAHCFAICVFWLTTQILFASSFVDVVFSFCLFLFVFASNVFLFLMLDVCRGPPHRFALLAGEILWTCKSLTVFHSCWAQLLSWKVERVFISKYN